MIYAIILFILFSFLSYRLIGSESFKGNAFLSSLLSFIFSSALYFVLHIRQNPNQQHFIQFDHFTFLYFITLIIVSMAFSLLLEMLTDRKDADEQEVPSNPVERMKIFFKTKIRYLSLLSTITRNGLLKSTLQTNKELRNQQTAIALRKTLEDAGGVFIKFGQFLSTRSDLFSKTFIEELAQLQENAPHIPSRQIEEIITSQLKLPLEDIFQSFEETPLAAASIAQVHKGRLKSGEEVAVKVLRPDLRKQLTVDITILKSFSKLLAEKTEWAKQIGIVSLTQGFIQNLFEEVDFSVELANSKQIRQGEDSAVYIPKVYEEYSNSNILVIEFLEGISIQKIDSLPIGSVNRQETAQIIFHELLTQIFDRGIFHGDPHPGNIYILQDGRPAFIDFGSVGRLSKIQRSGFSWLLLGISRKNAECMVTGVKNLVVNSEEIDAKKLEQSLSQFLIENTFEGDIMEEMGSDLFAIMSQHGLQFYPSVAGAFRSLVTLQGSLQALDPTLSLNDVLEEYIHEKMRFKSLKEMAFGSLEDDLLNMIPKIRSLPKKLDTIIQKVENDSLTFRMSLFSDEANVKFVNSVLSLLFMSIAGMAFGLLSLGALFLAQTEAPDGYSFLDVFGYSGLGLSVIMLIRVAIQSMRRIQ